MMMKLLLWLSFLATAHSFGFTRLSARTSLVVLQGWFDFKPMHGGGSGGNEDSLDEQWEAQQAILRARRGQFDKDTLRSKYKHASDVPAIATIEVKEEVNIQKHEDEMMYFAGSEKPTKPKATPKTTPKAPSMPTFKMPWDK